MGSFIRVQDVPHPNLSQINPGGNEASPSDVRSAVSTTTIHAWHYLTGPGSDCLLLARSNDWMYCYVDIHKWILGCVFVYLIVDFRQFFLVDGDESSGRKQGLKALLQVQVLGVV